MHRVFFLRHRLQAFLARSGRLGRFLLGYPKVVELFVVEMPLELESTLRGRMADVYWCGPAVTAYRSRSDSVGGTLSEAVLAR